ncbi:MAG: hypothetical protein PCFJNLEI_02293 [Verrucomicrobiae bacterium]|nr:hypothetical protein [Verrucomicrobiae bacterium]
MANPWLPRWGDPAVRYDRGWRYPTAAEILAAKTQPTLKGRMNSQRYYPNRISAQVPWLENFRTKVPALVVPLSLPPAHVDACVASCDFMIYVLSPWLTAVRAFGPAATAAMDLLLNGTGPDAVVLPVFNLPALPPGVAPVPPGALNRLFDLVQVIKNSPGYTETIGQDLNIIGPAASASSASALAAPDPKLKLMDGTGQKAVLLTFKKNGHMGVTIEWRFPNGQWQFLAVDTESPYLDDRPLQVAGTPEVREYRMRYWDKGFPNGDWSDVDSITVGP